MTYQTTVLLVQETTKADSWRSPDYVKAIEDADDWIARVIENDKPAQVAITITLIEEKNT